MFGYVKPVSGDLLVKEYEFYKATYCGICRAMKKHTGALSNVTLSYDSVFLAMVRMIYVPDSAFKTDRRRCIAHPMKKRPMLRENEAIEYTARAFALFAYYKLRDDMADDGATKRVLVTPALPIIKGGAKRAGIDELAKLMGEKLDAISALERERCPSIDEPAHLFGEILGAVFSHGLSGADRTVLYQCGYHLGKFIYAADAADDIGEDAKNGSYNPFLLLYGAEPDAEQRRIIEMAMRFDLTALAAAVDLMETHPLLPMIRNIIYLGMPSVINKNLRSQQ